MLSTSDFAGRHPSEGPPPHKRRIFRNCPATAIIYCPSVRETHGSLQSGTSVENYRQDTPRLIAKAPSRNLKRPRSYEAAPTRSISVIPPVEDVRMSVFSPEVQRSDNDVSKKLVIVMVGLPARGKSYVTKKLCRYLNWLQHDTKIFNVGNRRRKIAGRPLDSVASGRCSVSAPGPPPGSENLDHSAGFFDPDNIQAARLREYVAMETLDELLDYLMDEGGSVAIFDATNSTIERRRLIVKRVKDRAGPKLRVLFLESQCFDEDVCVFRD